MKFPTTFPMALAILTGLVAAQKPDGQEDDLLFFGIPAVQDSVQENKPPAPVVAPAGPASAVPLAKKAAAINVLLLDLPERSFATARLATLQAVASQSGNAPAPELHFNRSTPSLQKAAELGAAVLRGKIKQFPDGVKVQYDIGGAYSGHETDSAALAAAVLLESLASGRELDPRVALLGGVGEGGKVTKVYGVGTRLRSLEGTGPAVVGVPMEAEPEVRDLALMGEYETLVRMPVFALAAVEDGVALADSKRPDLLAKAITLFATIQDAAAKTPIPQLIKNPKVQERLNEILTAAPHHLSARLLLQAATGKLPGRMTFLTSQQAILKAVKPFWDVYYTWASKQEVQRSATICGNKLNEIQFKVHPVTERYLVATRAYLRALNNHLDIREGPKYQDMRVRSAAALNKIRDDIQREKEALDKMKEVRE